MSASDSDKLAANKARISALIEGAAETGSDARPDPAPAPKAKPARGGRKRKAAADGAGGEADEPRGRAAAQSAVMALIERCDLWHAPDETPYATVTLDGRRETVPLRSRRFRNWLALTVFEQTGETIGKGKVEDALAVFEGRATRYGAEREPWLRVGWQGGRIYVDLGDKTWRVVEISATGWRLIANPGLPFVRRPGMIALPVPEAGYELSELVPFVNAETDHDFTLIVGWLIGAFREGAPFAVLAIGGRQGSGKSVLTKLLRRLIDPNVADIRSPAREERDLIIWAKNGRVIAMDNISRIEPWMADALCRIANGAGFSTRSLNTDDEEMIFAGRRPIIINSIPEVATVAPDLAERTMSVSLRVIQRHERRTEREMAAAWEVARPRVLGTLFDGLSAGLANIDTVEPDELPRMADFVAFVTACEPGLGWEPGTFAKAFAVKSAALTEASFQNSALCVAIEKLLADLPRRHWKSPPTELLAELTARADEATKRQRSWPGTPQALGSMIKRLAPLLETHGILVDTGKSEDRYIALTQAER